MTNSMARVKPASHASPLKSFMELTFIRASDNDVAPLRRWSPPEGLSYCDACKTGQQYADEFVNFLIDNPSEVGSNKLGMIASDIDYRDPSRKGFWVGFFARIEHVVARAGSRCDGNRENCKPVK